MFNFKFAPVWGLVLIAVLAAAPASASLVAFWDFEDGTASDVTGNGFDGAFEGTATTTMADTAGAFSMRSMTMTKGNNRMRTVAMGGFGLGTGDFTVLSFVRRLTTSTVDDLLGDGGPAPTFRVRANDFVGLPPNGVVYELLGPPVVTPLAVGAPMGWQLLAIRREAGFVSAWLDGAMSAPMADGSNLDLIAADFSVGALSNSLNGIAGLFDDVAIYNEALSDNDLSFISTAGVAAFSQASAVPEPSTSAVFGLMLLGGAAGIGRRCYHVPIQ